MARIIVFDVNQTLLDLQTLSPHFEHMFGEKNALREWFSLLLLHSEAATLAGPTSISVRWPAPRSRCSVPAGRSR